jgi:hypothetical protein
MSMSEKHEFSTGYGQYETGSDPYGNTALPEPQVTIDGVEFTGGTDEDGVTHVATSFTDANGSIVREVNVTLAPGSSIESGGDISGGLVL